MSEFERASAVVLREGVGLEATVPDGWQQGRGAFGGLVLGTLVRAMGKEAGDDRRLRALNGDLCAPLLPGRARLRASLLRRGKNVTNVGAEIAGETEIIARASGVFAPARAAGRAEIAPDAPPPADWRALDPLPLGGFAPVFTKHFHFRSTGPLPFSAAREPVTEGFVGFAEPTRTIDDAAVIALLDAWWPAIFSVDAGPSAVATVSFTAEIVGDPDALDPTEPLRYRGRVAARRAGFFVELRELWSGDVLVAMNQQTFAVLGAIG